MYINRPASVAPSASAMVLKKVVQPAVLRLYCGLTVRGERKMVVEKNVCAKSIPLAAKHQTSTSKPRQAASRLAVERSRSPRPRGGRRCQHRQCTFPPLGGSRSPLRPPTDQLLAGAAVAPSSPGAGLAFPRTSPI